MLKIKAISKYSGRIKIKEKRKGMTRMCKVKEVYSEPKKLIMRLRKTVEKTYI